MLRSGAGEWAWPFLPPWMASCRQEGRPLGRLAGRGLRGESPPSPELGTDHSGPSSQHPLQQESELKVSSLVSVCRPKSPAPRLQQTLAAAALASAGGSRGDQEQRGPWPGERPGWEKAGCSLEAVCTSQLPSPARHASLAPQPSLQGPTGALPSQGASWSSCSPQATRGKSPGGGVRSEGWLGAEDTQSATAPRRLAGLGNLGPRDAPHSRSGGRSSPRLAQSRPGVAGQSGGDSGADHGGL